MKRKPIFRKPDPFRREIEAAKERLSARIPPPLDYAKIKKIMAGKLGENNANSL